MSWESNNYGNIGNYNNNYYDRNQSEPDHVGNKIKPVFGIDPANDDYHYFSSNDNHGVSNRERGNSCLPNYRSAGSVDYPYGSLNRDHEIYGGSGNTLISGRGRHGKHDSFDNRSGSSSSENNTYGSSIPDQDSFGGFPTGQLWSSIGGTKDITGTSRKNDDSSALSGRNQDNWSSVGHQQIHDGMSHKNVLDHDNMLNSTRKGFGITGGGGDSYGSGHVNS